MLIIQRPTISLGDEVNNVSPSASAARPRFGHTLGNSLRRTLLSSIPGRGTRVKSTRCCTNSCHRSVKEDPDIC